MADLADKAALANQDLTMGGIITNVREGYGKQANHTVLFVWKTIPDLPNYLSLAMTGLNGETIWRLECSYL